MNLQLIVAACMVTLGVALSQPFNQMGYRIVPEKMKGEIKIRENFQNLFDSIANSDKEQSEIYRHALKEEVGRQKHVFRAMKEEIRTARNKHFSSRRHFYRKRSIDENLKTTTQREELFTPGWERGLITEPPSTGHVTILIIGLGNPGTEYSQTRHNIGFIVADELAKQYQTSFGIKKNFQCEMCKAARGTTQTLIFIKPTTYMNLSGKSALLVKTYYNIPHKNIIVIHDDVDLDVGRIKVKVGGGNGGHNGLKSIDAMIGNKYTRVRIGIGRPQNRQSVADYVLDKFDKLENKLMQQTVNKITSNFHVLLDSTLEAFRNKIL